MKIVQKVLSTFSASVLVASSMLTIALPGIAHAAAQTCDWVGTAGDKKFSTATNWNNCNSDVPQAGDILNFNSSAFADQDAAKLTNDLNIAYGGIVANRDVSNGIVMGVNISGAVKLTDGATLESKQPPSNFGTSSFAIDMYDLTNNISGLVTSTGSITVIGDVTSARFVVAGTLTVEGNDPLNPGGLYLDAQSDLGALSIGDRVGITYFGVDATHKSKTIPFPINFVSTSSSLYVAGYCNQWSGMSCLGYDDVTYTDSNPITLAGDSVVSVDTGVTFNITGAITGGKLTKSASSNGILNIGGVAVTQPVKTTQCSDKLTTTNADIAQNETYVANAGCERSVVHVYSGGVIKGNGAKMWYLSVDKDATVAPGNSPGCIASDLLYLSGIYQFELGGTDPCTGYDQLQVKNSSNNTADVVTLDAASATLVTSRYNGYTPKQGQVFTIIDQAGTVAVKGTFKGLVEGATFTQNGVTFKISYVGGTGNDVTLTVQNQPTTPDTGFALATANNLVGLASTVVIAGGLVLISRKMVAQTKK